MKDRPSPAILRQLLRYDPESGKLFWLIRDRSFFATDKDHKWWNSRFANKEAFTAAGGPMGHRHGKIFGTVYSAHMVAWAIHYGAWPGMDIDHEAGILGGNGIANLRLVSDMQNMQNKSLYKSNKSGVHGVSMNKSKGQWAAYITIDKVRTHIGYFDNVEDAKTARLQAQEIAGFHPNHGRLQ